MARVAGFRRVPLPPAKMMPFIGNSSPTLTSHWRPLGECFTSLVQGARRGSFDQAEVATSPGGEHTSLPCAATRYRRSPAEPNQVPVAFETRRSNNGNRDRADLPQT